MKQYSNCPVCDHTHFEHYLSCVDYTVSKEKYPIVRCKNCSFVFTDPIPNENKIGSYYESEDYISHSNSKKGIVSSLYQFVRNYTLAKKVVLLNDLSKRKNILDIGAGTGEFLSMCQKNGYSIEGIEPSEAARQQAENNFNIKLNTEQKLKSFQNSSFDFITMWHVLEHVYHLNDRVSELNRLVTDKGHVIIAVPNHTSFDAKLYQEHWAAYDVPRHLYHFSPNSIKQLFEKHGFKLKKTLPMIFDSFYVSMLSEKYKTGSVNLIKAFFNGLRSNIKADAQKTSSSQIYIFSKN